MFSGGPDFGFGVGRGPWPFSGSFAFGPVPAAGTWTFEFSDSFPDAVFPNYSVLAGSVIRVQQGAAAPVDLNLSAAAVTLTRGRAMAAVTASASGGDGSFSFSIAPALPSGLSINATTGTISGTPGSVQGPTPYIVTVTDGTGATATASLTITVQEDDTRVADSFAEEGGAFVARRMDRMLSSEPRGFRLDSRRRAQGIRELTARARDSDGFLRFSGAGVSGSGRWHGWIEGDFSRQTDATGAARTEGDFGLLSAGADYLLNENLALGLMVQADAARDRA